MKKSRYSDSQIMAILKQAETGSVNLHVKLTQVLHLILTRLVRSSITHRAGFLPVVFSF